MKQFILFLFCVTGILNGNSQIITKAPLSDRQTGYVIDASLNTETKNVSATMRAFWVNKSTDTVPDIRMHLYMNAFKNPKSTMFSELPELVSEGDTNTGKTDIRYFKDRYGNDLIPLMKFVSPDDGNESDQTVLDVRLVKPALPGDTVFIKMNFETKLPHLSRRTGFNGDFYFVAQWFPKFGVYEPADMRYAMKGAWNCHQFHANSEFYSNHSVYDVKISVPVEYTVGSCGLLMNIPDTTGKMKTLAYRAEDIVDFAWTAWPGYETYTDQWKNVKITLLMPKERSLQVKRQFSSVKYALEYLDNNVGPYPWTYMTIVDPPAKGAASGGMEYTTMFTSLSAYMMPGFYHLPETVTIHEFGHAYFMGILASNKFEEPWLDEGVNSFWEQRIVDHYYGEKSGMIDLPFLKISDKEIARISYTRSSGRQHVSNKEFSWNYPHGTYGMMSYFKSSTWLHTLMGIVGEETTNEIFREYYKKWAFRYPSGKDFVNVVNEVVTRIHGNKFGPDMNWFFEQTLYGTGICDYKVTGFTNNKIFSSDEVVTKNDSLNISQKQVYKSVVTLERAGEVMLPEDILVHFNDGKEITESWDGKSRYKDFIYTGTNKIDWVKIDPEYKIRMDINFINNSLTDSPDNRPVRTLTNKLIIFLEFFISIFSI